MEFTIKSKKLGQPVTFFCSGTGGYIYANLNGKVGTLGQQICKGGLLTGSTLSHTYIGECEAESAAAFAKTCRAWLRSYLEGAHHD